MDRILLLLIIAVFVAFIFKHPSGSWITGDSTPDKPEVFMQMNNN